MPKLEKLKLNENQLKVIKDRYLRDTPTPEEWLFNVAENIALAELLYNPEISKEEIFEGVNHVEQETLIYEKDKSTMVLLHKGIDHQSDRIRNFKRFIQNLNTIAQKNTKETEDFRKARDKFYKLMSRFEFLPNSPTLMNASRSLQQLSACYVLPVGDSIEEIYDSVKHMAQIHQSGGGTGFSFSRLRMKHDEVSSTMGVSSGPVSFMQIFDKSTDIVKQGGTRRGANMGILRYDHPDIMDFINVKKTPGVLENFNISVALDERFMNAAKNNQDYELINPKGNKVVGKINAKKVWNELVKSAWETGDPGIVFIDRINNSDSNPTPELGLIESTNPCGEQPLLPYEPCNLGSINLAKFVDLRENDMDWPKLKDCVFTSIHFLDNVIDVNNFPLPQIEEMSKSNRRIGLGVMGWAETLSMLELPYSSEAANKKAEEVMNFINVASLEASEQLAMKRGVFPNFQNSIFDKKGKHFRGIDARPRNCARTTIAPTGTIGITAGLQGAGIEPFFAVVYTRYNATSLDAIKEGRTPDQKDVFYEINPLFKQIAEQNKFFGMKAEELWDRIDKNHKSLKGIKEIPEEIQNCFLTAHDLTAFEHVKMQCAFQKYTNNAVSKTVNLKNEATVDDVEAVYNLAYELGAKGVTTYRDGSKSLQVLNINDKDNAPKKVREYDHGYGELSHYYEILTGQGPLHINIIYDEFGPKRIFTNISPIGTEISGLATALGILLSKYFELGGDPVKVLKHLNSIKGDKPYGFGTKRVDSIPHGIAKALRDHMIKTGMLQQINGQQILAQDGGQQKIASMPTPPKDASGIFCPKCFSNNVGMLSGCSKPTCFDCGYSECS
jgi:ribonucleoside-diphosphate reductase alpha chain